MIRHVQRELPQPPSALADPGEDALKALAAARRALPIQRLIGNGMDYADAIALHDAASRGVAWTEAACWAGAANLQRASDASSPATKRAHLFHAAACFRFGQSVLMRDDPEKVAIYRRALQAFTEAAALTEPVYEKVRIPWGDQVLLGWLIRPSGNAPAPVVIIFGGADGWREEYHSGALALRDRDLATLLLDGPGQGETRILGGVRFPLGGRPGTIDEAFSAAVTFLLSHPQVADRVGIWGNSLGGTLAALTASRDPRLAACCVNGGSASPANMLPRFPRFAERLAAMTGVDGLDAAQQMLKEVALPPRANEINCPLLVLHGGADPLFSIEEAVAIAECAPAAEKQVLLWDDGDHCLYNHSFEKHALVADWFADQLNIG